MTTTSNPRKLYQSGNGIVVSLPDSIRSEAGLEKGDRVVLTAQGGQVTIEAVEWEVSTDE